MGSANGTHKGYLRAWDLLGAWEEPWRNKLLLRQASTDAWKMELPLEHGKQGLLYRNACFTLTGKGLRHTDFSKFCTAEPNS